MKTNQFYLKFSTLFFFFLQCNAKNIRLIVMNNLLPTSIKMHQKYDLKGSTYKRKVRFIILNIFILIHLCHNSTNIFFEYGVLILQVIA